MKRQEREMVFLGHNNKHWSDLIAILLLYGEAGTVDSPVLFYRLE
jgi:hypothetical protein